ncbi:ABC transporter permease [Thermocrinis jamiesonii]|uniref:ABC transporter permease n=1 Tax=Thermocrinis jamiesonii TaxID=1302351 RepID=UPI0004975707|nr:ABC transporter permease [Thermocrinis jamiesonii]
MLRFVLLRLIQSFFTLVGVTFISFLIIKLAPADYFAQLKLNPQISPETIEALRKQYGLDQPILIQYLKWLKSALMFDLGISFQYHTPVLELIKERIGNTLLLTVPSAVLSWLIAVPLGLLAGMKEGSTIDKLIRFISYVFMSFPSFFLAFLLLLMFSKSAFFQVGGWQSLLVGIITITLISTAGLIRLMRSAVIEVLNSPMVLMLRAKGLRGWTFIRHIIKNAMNPFTTLIGYEIAGLLSGAALVEIIVGWPGLGSLMLDAVLATDLFLVMGGLYIGTIMLLFGNFVADLLLAYLDPRVREKEIFK